MGGLGGGVGGGDEGMADVAESAAERGGRDVDGGGGVEVGDDELEAWVAYGV